MHRSGDGWIETQGGGGVEGKRDDDNCGTRWGLTWTARLECSAVGSRGKPSLTFGRVPGEVGSQSASYQPPWRRLEALSNSRCSDRDRD